MLLISTMFLELATVMHYNQAIKNVSLHNVSSTKPHNHQLGERALKNLRRESGLGRQSANINAFQHRHGRLFLTLDTDE